MLITCATIAQSYLLMITAPMLGISGGTQAILSFKETLNKSPSAGQRIFYPCRMKNRKYTKYSPVFHSFV